jgi:ABC-type uncharacterized transport system auxiliary subunit
VRRAALLFAAASALAGLSGGCISKPALTAQSFSIDPPPAAPKTAVTATKTLELDRVDVAPAYAGRPLSYRTGAHEVERDPYARFAAPPGAMLGFALRGYLANADFVRDVVPPGSALPVDARLETTVVELYGDLPEVGGAAAVLTVEFRVVSGTPPSELLQKTYSRRVPVARRAAAAFVEGWSEGLSGVVAEFLGDLRTALASAGTRGATLPPAR